jgi:hypothetical protein
MNRRRHIPRPAALAFGWKHRLDRLIFRQLFAPAAELEPLIINHQFVILPDRSISREIDCIEKPRALVSGPTFLNTTARNPPSENREDDRDRRPLVGRQ